MHTSATPGRSPAVANSPTGYLNPNPGTGVIVVKFSDNFNRYYGGFSGFVPPVSGTPVTTTVANTLYTIVSLGTATLAQWLAVGVPPGIVPAVGVSFIATASQAIGGSAAVEVPATGYSGIDHIEAIGDANTTIFPIAVGGSPNVGGWAYFQCLFEGAATAPAAGTAIGMAFYMGQSSVAVRGE